MRGLAAFSFLLSLASLPALATDSTVRGLLRDCEAALGIERDGISSLQEAVATTRCVSSVQSLTTVLIYQCDAVLDGYRPAFAADAPPSLEASIQSFVNWARANPGDWAMPAIDGLLLSILADYPCPSLE
jgi:hypothetical protein